jgi:dienelactone hydrolase
MKQSTVVYTLILLSTIVFANSSTAAAQGNEQSEGRLPRTNLLLYHNRRGDVTPVTSKTDWQKRRAEIVRGFESVAGRLRGREKRCPLEVQIEAITDCGAYERRLINYQSEPGSRVPAYLLIPKSGKGSRKTYPGVLCLHSTDIQYGPRVLVEKVRATDRAYANELAERGFVVLAPAYPSMANHQPDLKKLGWQSGTLKAVWDNRRGLDLLDSMKIVKPGRYGAFGHSLGGHNAIYTALFEDRIKVVVSSCGFDSYLDYYGGDPKNWEPGQGWCQERYLPKLAGYAGRLEAIPFDFHELLGALAPRPIFVNAPLGDTNFKAGSVDRIWGAASQVYALYGAKQHMHLEHPDCGHDFPGDVRERAYQLLEKELR